MNPYFHCRSLHLSDDPEKVLREMAGNPAIIGGMFEIVESPATAEGDYGAAVVHDWQTWRHRIGKHFAITREGRGAEAGIRLFFVTRLNHDG